MNDRVLHIEIATRIARRLARDAVWAGDCCTWMVSSELESEADDPSYVAADNTVEAGVGGVALLLSRLLSRQPEPVLRTLLRGTLERLLHTNYDADSTLSTVLIEGGSTLEDEQLVARGKAVYAAERPAADNDHGTNATSPFCFTGQHALNSVRAAAAILGGTNSLASAGTWDAMVRAVRECVTFPAARRPPAVLPAFADLLIELGNTTGQQEFQEFAKQLGRFSLDLSMQQGLAWPWDLSAECPPIGLWNGLAGIAHFHLRLYDRTVPSILYVDSCPSH